MPCCVIAEADDTSTAQASTSQTVRAKEVRHHPVDVIDPDRVRDEIFKMTAPTEWEAELPDPLGLKCQLFAYQRKALAWMAWRESFSNSAAIHPAACPPPNAMLRLLALASIQEVDPVGTGIDTPHDPLHADSVPMDPFAASCSGRNLDAAAADESNQARVKDAGTGPRTRKRSRIGKDNDGFINGAGDVRVASDAVAEGVEGGVVGEED